MLPVVAFKMQRFDLGNCRNNGICYLFMVRIVDWREIFVNLFNPCNRAAAFFSFRLVSKQSGPTIASIGSSARVFSIRIPPEKIFPTPSDQFWLYFEDEIGMIIKIQK